MKLNSGTILDSTLIGARNRPKNEQMPRDSEMHQTCKGRHWQFGTKLHIAADSQSGLTHSAVATAAKVHDKHALPQLLHAQEQRVYSNSAYVRQKKLIHGKAPTVHYFANPRTRRHGAVDEAARRKNRNKAKIRAPRQTCVRRGQMIVCLYEGELRAGSRRTRTVPSLSSLWSMAICASTTDGTATPVMGEYRTWRSCQGSHAFEQRPGQSKTGKESLFTTTSALKTRDDIVTAGAYSVLP
jgi:IS5 family transposase